MVRKSETRSIVCITFTLKKVFDCNIDKHIYQSFIKKKRHIALVGSDIGSSEITAGFSNDDFQKKNKQQKNNRKKIY